MAKQTFTTGQVLTAAQMTSLQQTAMLGGAASAKTASYTLVAADAGTAISMSNASATTITVNTALFAAGDTVHITNLGAGVCTITAGTATVNSSASLALAQYESGFLDFTSTSAAIFIKGAGAAATAGGMTVIASGSLSGTSVNISSIPSTFINLQLVVKDFNFSTNAILVTRCNTISTGYWGTRLRNLAGTATLSTAGTGQLGVTQDLLATNADNIQVINIYDYASTTARKLAFTQFFGSTDTNDDIGFATFQKIETTSAITSIQIEASAGTFSAGNYILYGVK